MLEMRMDTHSGAGKSKTVDFSFAVAGMSCASCVYVVEKELGKVAGVDYVSVNLTGGKAYVVGDGRPDRDDLFAAVKRAGYQPLVDLPSEEEVERKFRLVGRRLALAWAVALPAMLLMVLSMSGVRIRYMEFLEAAAGIGTIIGPGRQILKGAWVALTHRHANMDVLVSLSVVAAWVTAVLAGLAVPIQSFGALAPMLAAFHLTGRYVEARLRRRAGADLRSLMSLKGENVSAIGADGTVWELPVEAVKEGMRLKVRSGERIPLDAVIISGSGAVSEAMISGEPLPLSKAVGDEVIGGTVLESGFLEVEVLRTGEDAFLARMLVLVEQAQGIQVPLQALADRVAGLFVPVVFGFSMAVLAAWALFYPSAAMWLERVGDVLWWVPAGAGGWTTAVFAMVSMLVVACPCALGLATPMALSVGNGLAARNGLLIKGGEALQTAGELDVLLFDKTGTLTEGRPSVVHSSLNAADASALVSLETYSVHPLARAIVEWNGGESGEALNTPTPQDVKEEAGKGIGGTIDGVQYTVGRALDAVDVEVRSGHSVIQIWRDGSSAGFLVLADEVKPDAVAAVDALKKRGVRPVMITGDAEGTALSVATMVGIPVKDVKAKLHPEDKLRIVQDFQQSGLRVGMIGDGINDAAALKAADVGFALSDGTDLSMEAGDVVITHGGLKRIVEALTLSSLMVRAIKGNLFWAFIYNVLALPLAAAALVHPLMAEFAMSISSVAVLFNSLAIRRRYERKSRRTSVKE